MGLTSEQNPRSSAGQKWAAWWAALMIAVCLLTVLLVPKLAFAHVSLRSSVPAKDATVEAPVREIRLRFSQTVEPRYTIATVAGSGGEVNAQSAEVVPGSEGREVSLAVGELGPGQYTVSWRAAARDGHVVSGRFSFAVRPAQEPISTEEQPAEAPSHGMDVPKPDEPATEYRHDDGLRSDEPLSLSLTAPLPVAIRWLHFLAILGMVGTVTFHLFVLPVARRRRSSTSGTGTDMVGSRAWWIGALSVGLLAPVVVGRLWMQSAAYHGTELAWDGTALRHLVTGTTWGKAWLLEVLAGVAFSVGLLWARRRSSRSRWTLAAGAVLAISLVPPLSGHAVTVERFRSIAVLSDTLHVLGAGAWLGTLLVLLLAGILRRPAVANESESPVELVSAFSPLALTAAALTAAGGLANALFQFSAPSDLWMTGYGITLLVKLGFVALVAAAGFYNWRRVLPAINAGASPRKLIPSASLELLVALAVILVTAILVVLPRP